MLLLLDSQLLDFIWHQQLEICSYSILIFFQIDNSFRKMQFCYTVPWNLTDTSAAALKRRWRAPIAKMLQGLYSLSDKTSYRKISWSLEAASFGFKLFLSLWNLTATSAAALKRRLSNFGAILRNLTGVSSALRLRCLSNFKGQYNKIASFNVWVRYFVLNFKGILWTSTRKNSYSYIER